MSLTSSVSEKSNYCSFFFTLGTVVCIEQAPDRGGSRGAGGALQIPGSAPARTQNFVNTAVISTEYSTASAPRRITLMQLSQQKVSH